MEAPTTNYAPIPKSKLFHNYTGREFGFWRVNGYLGKRYGNQIWECECICGNVKPVHGGSLHQGTSTSCGCKSLEKFITRLTTHGLSKSSEYKIWQQIINRCTNPKAINWKDYGGRGIRICNRWLRGENGKTGFECFYDDMGPRPEKLTIHRKDNDGNYEPTNCVWATRLVQNNESRHNNMLTFDGKTQSLSNWAREKNLSRTSLSLRINRDKWSVERALTTPMRVWPKPR